MFSRTTPEGVAFSFSFEGRAIPAREGDSIAAALLAAGVTATRTTPVSGSARGPWCMMGACFDCLAVVDGVGNVQTCMVAARPGMAVSRQPGVRDLDAEDVT